MAVAFHTGEKVLGHQSIKLRNLGFANTRVMTSAPKNNFAV